MGPSGLAVLVVVITAANCVSSRKVLAGHNLRVVVSEASPYSRRITDEIVKWLSRSLGFSYAVQQTSATSFANTSTGIGTSAYLLNGMADLILGGIVMSQALYQRFDLPFPLVQGNFEILIPSTNSSLNIGAPWKPFTSQVWVAFFVTLVVIVATLYLVIRFGHHERKSISEATPLLTPAVDYTVYVLFSQGGVCYSGKLSIRVIAGVWCIGTFFLVNSYTSTLISYITSPNRQPLIESIYDLRTKPHIHIAVEEGYGPDRAITGAQNGILKFLDDSLKKGTSIRCRHIEKCIEKTLQGTHVLIQIRELLRIYIDEDYKRSKECRLAIAKKGFMSVLATMVLAKNSYYTSFINDRTIELIETGLPRKWYETFTPNPRQCLNSNANYQSKKLRISLKNLSSAFVILLFGAALSLIVFVLEVCSVCIKNYSVRRHETSSNHLSHVF